jgi:hypothetical protein
MKFEYHTFEVESYLRSGQQPSFTMKGVEPTSKYYTLVDPTSMRHALTTSASDGVRVPVFAVTTAPVQDEKVRGLTHGSLLFAAGLENAMRFMYELKLNKPIEKAIVVLATNCHELSGDRYRAYFGITLEVQP